MGSRLLIYVDSTPMAEGHFFPSATFKELGFRAEPGQHSTYSGGGRGVRGPLRAGTLPYGASGCRLRVGGRRVAWSLGRGRTAVSRCPEKPFPGASQLSPGASARPPSWGWGHVEYLLRSQSSVPRNHLILQDST